VEAWGDNTFGQLGDGTRTPHRTPAAVPGLTDVTGISGGREHVLALTGDGSVWSWGSGAQGQLGTGGTGDATRPARIASLPPATEVAAGHYHGLALLADGTVRAWGLNGNGQLGDGTTTNRTSPVTVTGLAGVASIAAGRDFSMALLSDHTVRAWGDNAFGELGDGTTMDRHTPVQVTGLSGVIAVSGGRDFALALKADGTVWAWGDNSVGQLGDGTTTNRTAPVRAGSLTGVVEVASGAYHALAVLSDGSTWAWGWNHYGQLGDGTTVDRRAPVRIASIAGITGVAAGRQHSLAVRSDRTAMAWGSNASGQLGDGTTTDRHAPVPVASIAGLLAASAGQAYSVALVGSTDTTAPTDPGIPSGASNAPGSIDLMWTASTDPDDASLEYRLFEDAADNLVAQVTSSSTSTVSFTRTGLVPGSSHRYWVQAADAAGNASAVVGPSADIIVQQGPPVIFADDFATGDFSRWTTATRLSIDAATGSPSPPSARGQVSGQSAFAARNLGATYGTVCMSEQVNVASVAGAPDLFRLRTASDGPIIKVYMAANRVLWIRSDASGQQVGSGAPVPAGTWAVVELCGTVGAATSWTLYLNGVAVVSNWTTNTGTTPVGRVQIGDSAAKTWSINIDDVRLDQSPG
jgi:alpha-tubulin suppressor-like RCC1 family protein